MTGGFGRPSRALSVTMGERYSPIGTTTSPSENRYPHRSFDARANRVVMPRLVGTCTKGSEVVVMMTLRDQLDDCRFLLARARLAGDRDAIQRHSEHRDVLVKQIAGMRTPLRLV